MSARQAQILIWGREMTTFYNEAYRPLMGSAFKDGIGKHYPEFRPDVWPAVRPSIEAGFRGEGRTVEDVEITLWRHGHAEKGRFTYSYAPIFDESGGVGGVIGRIVETTACVADRERLQRIHDLFRSTPSFLCMLRGPDHEVEFVNAAYEELVGRDDMVGKPLHVALPEALDQGFIALLDQVYATGIPHIGRDVKAEIREGRGPPADFYLDFIYQPILDDEGAVTGILVDGFDVTEAHQAKAQAEQLHRELVQAARMTAMVTMASALAHELNQPLTAARNYLSGAGSALRLRGISCPPVEKGIALASEQIGRAGEIIRRVRSMTSQRPVLTKKVDIARCVQNTLHLIQTAGVCSGVKIRIEGDDAPVFAMADEVQVEQIVFNLVKNACEAVARAERRNVVIRIGGDVKNVAVAIEDSGAGLPPDLTIGQFETFDSSKKDGLGIGLALCRTMVEDQGGRMRARNRHGGGAVVTFTLPAAPRRRADI